MLLSLKTFIYIAISTCSSYSINVQLKVSMTAMGLILVTELSCKTLQPVAVVLETVSASATEVTASWTLMPVPQDLGKLKNSCILHCQWENYPNIVGEVALPLVTRLNEVHEKGVGHDVGSNVTLEQQSIRIALLCASQVTQLCFRR